jgi:SAM-dependent methyltransferase
LENGDKLCPNCGSIARSRRLWDLIASEFLNDGLVILDFSPTRCLYRRLKTDPLINYISTDMSGDFLSDFHYDITNIDSENNKYDLILCYHVLEHIEDDYQAMKELYRIMKKGAACIIQTPFKEGNIYENSLIKTDQERLEHFGQEDHVRIYSLNGLKERLIECGFYVMVKQFEESDNNRFGFNSIEQVLICIK